MGQEAISKDEEVMILKRVAFKMLGEEELEDMEESIADRKSTILVYHDFDATVDVLSSLCMFS